MQLEQFLIPLLPFRSSDCKAETWNLHMADFEFELNVKNLISPFSSSVSEDVDLMNTVPAFLENQKQFFVASDDQRILAPERILFSVMLIATWWHVLNSGLCLHAAAVSRNEKGFLFLGEGGAGKSTISTISADLDIPVLAEDRVFVFKKPNNYLLAAGPHPLTEYTHYPNLRPNLRGIFMLVKDRDDYVKPIPHSEAAKNLYSAFLQNSASGYLPATALKLAFKTISDLARRIPTFELHFRVGPDFWKLIDEQFPN